MVTFCILGATGDTNNDSDFEISFKTNHNDHNDEQDIVVPRGGPKISNYQLNFDDMDFENDARDSGIVHGSSDIDEANHNENQGNVKDDSMGFGSLNINGDSSVETNKTDPIVDGIAKPATEGDPVKRKGVTFQVDENETFSKSKSGEDSTFEDPFATSAMTGEDDFSVLNKSKIICS